MAFTVHWMCESTVLLWQPRVALHQHMRCVGTTTTCEKVHNVCDHQLTAVDSVDSDVFSLVMLFVFSDVQLSFACFQFTVMSTVWFWFFSACVATTRPNARPPFDNPKYSVVFTGLALWDYAVLWV